MSGSTSAPIKERTQDIFNRYDFSKRIAETIFSRIDPASIVIGINAEWGDGKTSVLNLIDKELENKDKIVRLKFNPWRFGSEEEILVNFFTNVAEAIDRSIKGNRDKIKEMWDKVGPLVEAVGKIHPVAGTVTNIGKSIIEAFPKKELEEVRDKVESLLDQEKTRVVILIDDIDRLEKNEIHAVFRLVKLTADFKFTAYVLAFDKQIVTNALADKYGHTNSLSGESFIDKIIQVPLELPKVLEHDLQQYLFDDIDDLLKFLDINISREAADYFYFHITDSLSQFIKTPSQVKLYSNTLMFSIPIIGSEVNIKDLMLIEGIRTFVPSLYKFIKNNRDQFLYPGAAASFLTTKNQDEDKEAWKDELQKKLNGFAAKETKGLIKLLMSLFPQIEALYSNESYDICAEEEWAKNKRICSSEYFDRYFSYAITEKDVSDLKIDSLLADIMGENFNPLNYKQWFDQEITPKNIATFFYKLRRRIDSFDDKYLEILPQALAGFSKEIKDKNNQSLVTAYWGAFHFISDCLEKLSYEKRLQTAINFIDEANNIEFALEWWKSFKGRIRQTFDSELLSSDDINQLSVRLANKIGATLPEMDDNDLTELTYLYHVLEYWHQHGQDKSQVEQFIKNRLTSDMSLLYQFLQSISTKSSHDQKFTKENYDAVSLIVHPKLIAESITKHYWDYLSTKEIKELAINEKLFRDFCSYYNDKQAM